MAVIKIERFWPKDIKNLATEISEGIEKKDFNKVNLLLDDLIDILADENRDGKSRVTICFIFDQLKMIDPFIEKLVDGLVKVLKDEKDSHVREFAVWALGQIVEETRSIDLIKETMPIFIRFCQDASEHVKSFALDIKDRLNNFIIEKENLDEKIQVYIEKLNELITDRIEEMNIRSKELSKEALGLDYRTAFERRSEMEKKIRKFKDLNAESEDEIIAFRDQLVKELHAFKGESRKLINTWRELRGEKEALIRRVHCILRIQGKIYRIITHITSKSNGKIDINELKEETQYSDSEIIEILKKLVDEEIIPNFMLDQIPDAIKMKNIEERSNNNSEEKLIKAEENSTKSKK